MARLSEYDISQFEEQGYVVVEGLLDQGKDLQPVIDEYSALLDSLAKDWHATGDLSQTYGDLPFGERLTRIIAESGQAYYQHMDFSLPQDAITKRPPSISALLFYLLRSPAYWMRWSVSSVPRFTPTRFSTCASNRRKLLCQPAFQEMP